MSKRCGWVKINNPLYVAYHDEEWGRPLHDDQALFELLCLETYQAGLSWETVLNKRQAFREAFHGYHLQGVADMTDEELEALLDNPAIIRNRAKVYSQAPAKTTLSETLSKDLKKRGFKFTGPVAVLSYLQAAGLVNDHENDCEWKNGD